MHVDGIDPVLSRANVGLLEILEQSYMCMPAIL